MSGIHPQLQLAGEGMASGIDCVYDLPVHGGDGSGGAVRSGDG